jgi:hypothetical protein
LAPRASQALQHDPDLLVLRPAPAADPSRQPQAAQRRCAYDRPYALSQREEHHAARRIAGCSPCAEPASFRHVDGSGCVRDSCTGTLRTPPEHKSVERLSVPLRRRGKRRVLARAFVGEPLYPCGRVVGPFLHLDAPCRRLRTQKIGIALRWCETARNRRPRSRY